MHNTAWVAVLGHLYTPNKERGVYKTTDGGKSWKQTLYVDDNTGVVDIDINPIHPDEIFAATWYRTAKHGILKKAEPPVEFIKAQMVVIDGQSHQ